MDHQFYIEGFRLIESSTLVVQFRFPRSKRRRIRNKWQKRAENFKPRPDAIFDKIHRIIYLHPTTAAILKRQMIGRTIRTK